MKNKKELAIQLRKQAKTYNEITKLLDIPKSTLSGWFKNIEIPTKIQKKLLTNAQKTWAKNIVAYNKKRSKIARAEWQKRALVAKKEIGKINQRELKLIGTALYWAEGKKKDNWATVFCNSDPEMILIMLRFYKEICKVPEEKFKAKIQIHQNINKNEAKKYWSKLTGIPLKNFRKTLYQAPISSKMKRRTGTLPYGMFRLRIADVKLVNKIQGWIKGIAEQG